MEKHVLVLGFAEDAFAVSDCVKTCLGEMDCELKVQNFKAKWELRNWLDENSSVIPGSRRFRHDSRVFFNGDIFCDRDDYEDNFFWHQYDSKNIALLIISSSTRELDMGSSDIVHNNHEFSKKLLPKTPQIVLQFSDGQWCEAQAFSLVELVKDFQSSVYHLVRDISTDYRRENSDRMLCRFLKSLVKTNYRPMVENYVTLINS